VGPDKDRPSAEHGSHDHDHDHDGHDEHGHGLAHVATLKVLVTTWAILMVLTVVTVLATRIDLGGTGNLVIAMVIATIKASLVCLYFMHLRYDKLIHTVAFLGALLFFILFVGLALMDTGQYQHTILWDPANLPIL
jgi:cytochrome c oxidase subunit 4